MLGVNHNVAYMREQGTMEVENGKPQPDICRNGWRSGEDKAYKRQTSGHDSTLLDSGFLSGTSLFSEENVRSPPPTTLPLKNSSVLSSLHTCDSGIDIDEELSRLDINTETEPREENTLVNKSLSLNCNEPSRDVPLWEEAYQQDEDGDNQLLIAVVHGFIEVVYSLVRLAPSPMFLDIQNNLCQTALHLAVLTHQPRIARVLVVSGASPDVRDRRGNTPMHLACQQGDLECVRALLHPVTVAEVQQVQLRYNCSGFIRPKSVHLEERNYDGEMCVHLAAHHGHMEILRHLYWYDADMNAREAKSGKTVLHLAVERRDLELVIFLVRQCGCFVDAETYAGYTPYQLAASARQGRIVDGLVSLNAARRDVPDTDTESSGDEMCSVNAVTFYDDMRINGVLLQGR